jgi:hypothetical protein
MVFAVQGIQRLLAGVQLSLAAAASPAASADNMKSDMGPLFDLQFKVAGCTEWLGHPRVWQAVAQLPGLHTLQFEAAGSDVVMPPSSVAQLSALAGLASTLQTLEIPPGLNQQQQSQVVDYSALGSLSRLTSLTLPLSVERQAFGSISTCSQLQHLHLGCEAGATAGHHVTLQPGELCALSQLTQLTRLWLYGAACEDSAGWNFLSSLRQLQELAVEPCLPYTAVAALAHLTCLSELSCGWEQREGAQQPTARCAGVRDLSVQNGVPPLCAFPGVTSLMQCMPWEPAVLASAAECCTQLKELALQDSFGGHLICETGSLHASAPAAARTAAVSSLAALQQLQKLTLSVNDNAEVAVASALRHVTQLCLVVPLVSSCTVPGLVVLAAMQQLQWLTLELVSASKSSLQDADVQVLLSAVRHVPHVGLRVQEKHLRGVQGVVRRAKTVLTEQGLQLSAKLKVTAIEEN